MIQTFNPMVGRMYDFKGYENEGLLNFFYVLTIIISQIVLLNLIISLISDTYGKVREAEPRRYPANSSSADLILEHQRRQSTSYVEQVDNQTRWTHVLSVPHGQPSVTGQSHRTTRRRVEELSSQVAMRDQAACECAKNPRGSQESRPFLGGGLVASVIGMAAAIPQCIE